MDYDINEDAIKKLAEPAVEAFGADVEEIRASHRGRPVDEVQGALEAAARSHGLEPSPTIRELAQDISDGTAPPADE